MINRHHCTYMYIYIYTYLHILSYQYYLTLISCYQLYLYTDILLFAWSCFCRCWFVFPTRHVPWAGVHCDWDTKESLQDGAPQLWVGLWTIVTPFNYSYIYHKQSLLQGNWAILGAPSCREYVLLLGFQKSPWNPDESAVPIVRQAMCRPSAPRPSTVSAIRRLGVAWYTGHPPVVAKLRNPESPGGGKHPQWFLFGFQPSQLGGEFGTILLVVRIPRPRRQFFVLFFWGDQPFKKG